jgi:hypothetical protein
MDKYNYNITKGDETTVKRDVYVAAAPAVPRAIGWHAFMAAIAVMLVGWAWE